MGTAPARSWLDMWPPAGLRLEHGDLVLRLATDDDAVELGRIVHGLLPVHQHHFMPRLMGDAVGVDEMSTVRNILRYLWSKRAELGTGDSWLLPFTVLFDGKVVGMQSAAATQFTALRNVSTGSYLASAVRGYGVGTRMRAMVVEFAFVHLGAFSALSSYQMGNDASRHVSERLGYQLNGVDMVAFSGTRYLCKT